VSGYIHRSLFALWRLFVRVYVVRERLSSSQAVHSLRRCVVCVACLPSLSLFSLSYSCFSVYEQ
jgi:hypothetical protein